MKEGNIYAPNSKDHSLWKLIETQITVFYIYHLKKLLHAFCIQTLLKDAFLSLQAKLSLSVDIIWGFRFAFDIFWCKWCEKTFLGFPLNTEITTMVSHIFQAWLFIYRAWVCPNWHNKKSSLIMSQFTIIWCHACDQESKLTQLPYSKPVHNKEKNSKFYKTEVILFFHFLGRGQWVSSFLKFENKICWMSFFEAMTATSSATPIEPLHCFALIFKWI